jgi:hypothetical protein
MACPASTMAVEDRFLAPLAGVRRLGFLLGELALTYETDGRVGVMLLEGRIPPAGPPARP